MDKNMRSILTDKNYEHFFIDGTFECIPAGYSNYIRNLIIYIVLFRTNASQLIVCMGYNETFDYFSPAFFALLDSKSEITYDRMHQSIANITNKCFRPLKWTLDFEKSHYNVFSNYSPKKQPFFFNKLEYKGELQWNQTFNVLLSLLSSTMEKS